MGNQQTTAVPDVTLVPQRQPTPLWAPPTAASCRGSSRSRTRQRCQRVLWFSTQEPGWSATAKSASRCYPRARRSWMCVWGGGDISNKAAVVNAKKSVFTNNFHVRAGDVTEGNELFQIFAKVWMNSTELRVSCNDLATGQRCLMGFEGHWRHHQGFMWLDRGAAGEREPVVKVWEQDRHFKTEVYVIEIAPNADVMMVLLICMILDERW